MIRYVTLATIVAALLALVYVPLRHGRTRQSAVMMLAIVGILGYSVTAYLQAIGSLEGYRWPFAAIALLAFVAAMVVAVYRPDS